MNYTNPLNILLFSEEQFSVSRNETIAFFDATGSVVRNPDSDIVDKQIFYYALVINKYKTTVPICEMISIDQSIPTIINMFTKYWYFVNGLTKRFPKMKTIVTDFCWASMNAILRVCNLMDMNSYLQNTYNFIVDSKPLPENFVSIYSCNAHFQHRVSLNIKHKFEQYKDKSGLTLETTGLMLRCTTWAELVEIFEYVVIVFCSTDSGKSDKAILQLKPHVRKMNAEDKEEEFEIDFDKAQCDEIIDLENDDAGKAIYSKSPKYFCAQAMHVKRKLLINEEDITNKFYIPALVDYMIEHYMAYCPLWTGIILSAQHPGKCKLSNATVEGFFRIIKEDVLKTLKKNPVRFFVEKIREKKSELCHRLKLKDDVNDQIKAEKKLSKIIDWEHNSAKAVWKKGEKRKSASHFLCETILNSNSDVDIKSQSVDSVKFSTFKPNLQSTLQSEHQ